MGLKGKHPAKAMLERKMQDLPFDYPRSVKKYKYAKGTKPTSIPPRPIKRLQHYSSPEAGGR